MRQKGISLLVVVFMIAVIGILIAILYFTIKPVGSPSITPMLTTLPATPAASSVPTPTPTSNPHEGWSVYQSEEYGFEISYPSSYEALDDANNLYGWPNAVVLLYNGGQAYDVVVEAWDSMTEYTSKHPATETFDVEIKTINGKFISVTNYTNEENNSEILLTLATI